jgi:hypothetical protein
MQIGPMATKGQSMIIIRLKTKTLLFATNWLVAKVH